MRSLFEIKNVLSQFKPELETRYKVARIGIFGSYARNEQNEKSDIDIAVGVLGDEELRIRQLGIIPKLGYRNNVTVNLHIFSRNKIDLNLFVNIANGIILEGFLEVRP